VRHPDRAELGPAASACYPFLRKSIPGPFLRYVGKMGLNDRMEGDRDIGLGVVELQQEATTSARLADSRRTSRATRTDARRAGSCGCAGMRAATATPETPRRADGCQRARPYVSMAIGNRGGLVDVMRHIDHPSIRLESEFQVFAVYFRQSFYARQGGG